MGLLNSFFKKRTSLLNEEDNRELREIEKNAYKEEAKKLLEIRGKEKAKNDILPQKREGLF